jgi:hypothetical protein
MRLGPGDLIQVQPTRGLADRKRSLLGLKGVVLFLKNAQYTVHVLIDGIGGVNDTFARDELVLLNSAN